MLSRATRWFAGLPTAAKLLLILSAALLPIGLGLVAVAHSGINEANAALRARSDEQSRAAARSLESLIARNALALRIAANGAFAIPGEGDVCARAQRSLTIAPGIAQQFELQASSGQTICAIGRLSGLDDLPAIAPGDIRLRLLAERDALAVRVGVMNGMATALVPASDLHAAVLDVSPDIGRLAIRDGDAELILVQGGSDAPRGTQEAVTRWPIGKGDLQAEVVSRVPSITTLDRVILVLPVAMWIIAALMTWLLVSRLLIRPLKMLQRAVGQVQPGDSELILPRKLGPAREIRELRDDFARALTRVEESERDMAEALDGQRRLVREVHHRVKNNLQVVASLLNIHGRSAETPPARAAYAAIARRVGALSIVHRNHFAEMEENRGIALRPLVTELAAELRAGAPETARSLAIELDVESVNTTQDVAVAVGFLVTEMVEYAMLHRPDDPIEVSLRRTSDLTARLAISSPVLVPDDDGEAGKIQFERIIGGLAKQLRSNLERKLGRYSVDLPVFPDS